MWKRRNRRPCKTGFERVSTAQRGRRQGLSKIAFICKGLASIGLNGEFVRLYFLMIGLYDLKESKVYFHKYCFPNLHWIAGRIWLMVLASITSTTMVCNVWGNTATSFLKHQKEATFLWRDNFVNWNIERSPSRKTRGETKTQSLQARSAAGHRTTTSSSPSEPTYY